MRAPCEECTRKGCGSFHDQCKEYLEYREWIEDKRKRKAKDTAYEGYRREGRNIAIRKAREKGALKKVWI